LPNQKAIEREQDVQDWTVMLIFAEAETRAETEAIAEA